MTMGVGVKVSREWLKTAEGPSSSKASQIQELFLLSPICKVRGLG